MIDIKKSPLLAFLFLAVLAFPAAELLAQFGHQQPLPRGDEYTLSEATGVNPGNNDVVAGAVDHLCLAFNLRQSDGTGGTLTRVNVSYAPTASPSDWVEMKLRHNGAIIATASSGLSPVGFNLSTLVPMTATDKMFEVLVTVADNALDGNALVLSVDRSSFVYSPSGSTVGASNVTGGAQTIFDGNSLSELLIQAQPGDGMGGAALSAQPVIHLINALDQLADDDNTTVVTANIVAGTGTEGAQIVAGQAATAVNGVVTFDGLAIDLAGTGYQLVFSVGSLTSDPSEAFNVEVGPAHALRVVAQPGGAIAGFNLGNPPVVEIIDAGGNRIELDNMTQITAAINEGTGTAGANLTGTTTVTVEEGLAAWETLSINLVGSGYELAFSAEGLEGAVSAPFQVASPFSGGGAGAGGGGCSSSPMPAGVLMLVGLLAVVGLARRRKAAV